MRWLHSAGQPNAAETHTASTSSSTCPRCPSLPFRKSNWRQTHKRFLALGPTVEAWLLELISTRRVAAPALSSSAKAEDLCYRWTPRHREKSSYLPSAGGVTLLPARPLASGRALVWPGGGLRLMEPKQEARNLRRDATCSRCAERGSVHADSVYFQREKFATTWKQSDLNTIAVRLSMR